LQTAAVRRRGTRVAQIKAGWWLLWVKVGDGEAE